MEFKSQPGTKRIPYRLIGIGAKGREYWIEDTKNLRVQHGRHGRVSLFRKKWMKFCYVDSYPNFDAAVAAADELDQRGRW